MAKAKEHEFVIEGSGLTPIDEIPEGAEVVNVEQPKTITVQDCLTNSIQMINQSMPNLLAYDDPALENFAIVIATVRRNMKACIEVLDKADQANKEARENGQNNPE